MVLLQEEMAGEDAGRGRKQMTQGGVQAKERGQRRGGAHRGKDHALGVHDPGRGQARFRSCIEKTDQSVEAAGLRPEVFIPEGEIAGRGQAAGVVAGFDGLLTLAAFQDGDLRESPFQLGKGGMFRLAGHHDDLQGYLIGLGQERVEKGEKPFGLGWIVDQADCQVGFNGFHDYDVLAKSYNRRKTGTLTNSPFDRLRANGDPLNTLSSAHPEPVEGAFLLSIIVTAAIYPGRWERAPYRCGAKRVRPCSGS